MLIAFGLLGVVPNVNVALEVNCQGAIYSVRKITELWSKGLGDALQHLILWWKRAFVCLKTFVSGWIPPLRGLLIFLTAWYVCQAWTEISALSLWIWFRACRNGTQCETQTLIVRRTLVEWNPYTKWLMECVFKWCTLGTEFHVHLIGVIYMFFPPQLPICYQMTATHASAEVRFQRKTR